MRFWLALAVVLTALSSASASAQCPPGYVSISCPPPRAGAVVPPPSLPTSAEQADPCLRPEIRSPGAISLLNSKIGQPDGPPSQVIAIEDPAPQGYVGTPMPNRVYCHVTLVLVGGKREPGMVHFEDQGASRPLLVSWVSDATAANNRATAQAQFEETPRGIVLKSIKAMTSSPEGQAKMHCVIMNKSSDPANVLEHCNVDPNAPYALGLIDTLLANTGALQRGGDARWVNAHCEPMVRGYRCEWNGLSLEYQ